MRTPTWQPIAAGLAVLLLATGATVAGSAVSVRVTPAKTIAGERLTVSARAGAGVQSCSGRVTRPSAPTTSLPRRTPKGGRVSWHWMVPVSARSGVGTVHVTCRRVGNGSGRFTIRGLPTGDPLAGKTEFLLNCGGCHTLADAGTQGTSLNLDETMPDYEKTVDRVVNGKARMPSFKTRLTPKQIADVSAYVSSAAGR